MSNFQNPFIRGYQNLRIIRTLLITYEDDCPPVWRPLHASQAHLPDDQVALFPCLFGLDFALITEDQDVSDELEAQCQGERSEERRVGKECVRRGRSRGSTSH